ncbi:MAG: hypothetical protein SVU32_05120, partial [Candidatus Nanohaloarchaea archaeon]|nr:hypothetical protein [Candidatus Nanohaloarchaea archaeon]
IETAIAFVEEEYGDAGLDRIIYGVSDEEPRGMFLPKESSEQGFADKDVLILRGRRRQEQMYRLPAHEYSHALFVSEWRQEEERMNLDQRWSHLLYEGHAQYIGAETLAEYTHQCIEELENTYYLPKDDDEAAELLEQEAVLEGDRNWEQDEDPLFNSDEGYRLAYGVVQTIVEQQEDLELMDIPHLEHDRAKRLVEETLLEMGASDGTD